MNLFPVFLHLLYLALPALASETAYVILAVSEDCLGQVSLSPEHWEPMEQMPLGTTNYLKHILEIITHDWLVQLISWPVICKGEVQNPVKEFTVGYKQKATFLATSWRASRPDGHIWQLLSTVHVFKISNDIVHYKPFFRNAIVEAALNNISNGDSAKTSDKNMLLKLLDHDTTSPTYP
eukprot:GHVS01088676.1.p1 GENE.GHVS01088676.1~~GHVS01088676.1.p1  ORF type:complete len:179 (+),score=5.58 GHVS01088676.1:178-714(+)